LSFDPKHIIYTITFDRVRSEKHYYHILNLFLTSYNNSALTFLNKIVHLFFMHSTIYASLNDLSQNTRNWARPKLVWKL